MGTVNNVENLAKMTREQFEEFLDSFDDVLCDCDGVIWLGRNPIAGVPETVNFLREKGKRVRFVSNNTAFTLKMYQKNFERHGLIVDQSNVVYPTLAIIDHLKKIGFNKKAFVIGTKSMKNELKEAGFEIASDGPAIIEENLDVLFEAIKDDENIGAVIVDIDINLNYIKLQRAITYLKRQNVLFIIGATDETYPPLNIIGPKHYQIIIEKLSLRKPLCLAKPSKNLNEYVLKKFGNTPKRTLFVGDSLHQDMVFGGVCGYKKLLVLTGNTTIEQLSEIECDDNKPDYYIKSFGDLSQIIKS